MGRASEGIGEDASGLDNWDKMTTFSETGNEEDEYICRKLSGHSFEQAGLEFPGRDPGVDTL